jgi:RAB6A-GEF complex partner protein 1
MALLLRPDSAIFVVHTQASYLITYSLATDPNSRVYKPTFSSSSSHRPGSRGGDRIIWGPGEGGGVREVSVRFRMVIKVDAGIERALALDDELVVATQKPAAIQTIRWTPDAQGTQTSTETLSKMPWLPKIPKNDGKGESGGSGTAVVGVRWLIHDRPMNLSTWVMWDGKAYAVQRLSGAAAVAKQVAEGEEGKKTSMFRGFCFHLPAPEKEEQNAVLAAINARFSLIAVGCESGEIWVYTARDYAGNIPLCHKVTPVASGNTTGRITVLTWSPDGYCLFAGYEKGWAMWSVYGKPGGNSFGLDREQNIENGDGWLTGVRDASWLAGGAEILLVGQKDERLWVLEMARSAVTSCFASANISRSLLQTNAGFMVYRGYEQPDLTSISAEQSLWQPVQIPPAYLVDQWPIKSAVISGDGRYVAVAGRKGLAHYSVHSGRWKTFSNEGMEREFTVRGGMCWFQHILIVAVESEDGLFEVSCLSISHNRHHY